jgi:hypothetical protein
MFSGSWIEDPSLPHGVSISVGDGSSSGDRDGCGDSGHGLAAAGPSISIKRVTGSVLGRGSDGPATADIVRE